jgi:hypothetical protein
VGRVLPLVWDLLARAQRAALDLALQFVPQLVVQRHRRAAADRPGELGQVAVRLYGVRLRRSSLCWLRLRGVHLGCHP